MFILIIDKFQKSKSEEEKETVVEFYLDEENLPYINNWDLVDASCYKILGEYLLDKPHKINILYNFTVAKNLWVRRISIVSTLAFIRQKQFGHTIKIATKLLPDKEDLI